MPFTFTFTLALTLTLTLSHPLDRRHMYVALQGGAEAEPGVIFDIFRLDGHPFGGGALDIKYHAS